MSSLEGGGRHNIKDTKNSDPSGEQPPNSAREVKSEFEQVFFDLERIPQTYERLYTTYLSIFRKRLVRRFFGFKKRQTAEESSFHEEALESLKAMIIFHIVRTFLEAWVPSGEARGPIGSIDLSSYSDQEVVSRTIQGLQAIKDLLANQQEVLLRRVKAQARLLPAQLTEEQRLLLLQEAYHYYAEHTQPHAQRLLKTLKEVLERNNPNELRAVREQVVAKVQELWHVRASLYAASLR